MKTTTTSHSARPTEQQRPSNHNQATILNKIPTCEFELYTAFNDEYVPNDFDDSTPYKVTYGFSKVKFWIPQSQSWVTADPEKFRVNAEDFATAKSEFWQRFHQYCLRRFGHRITATSTYHN